MISCLRSYRVQVAKMVSELSIRQGAARGTSSKGSASAPAASRSSSRRSRRLLLDAASRAVHRRSSPTLQQSPAARLDRLGSARDRADRRSAGPRILYVLAHNPLAGSRRRRAPQASLDRLRPTPTFYLSRAPPQGGPPLQHALIQDAAQDSLLKSRRQALHRRAAETLRESASPEPEAIAHYLHRGRPRRSRDRVVGASTGDQALRCSETSRRRSPISARRSKWRTGDDAASRPNAETQLPRGSGCCTPVTARR